MGAKSPLEQQKQKRLVRGLTLAFTFTAISTFAFALWANMTSEFSTVLEHDDIAVIQLDAPEEGTPLAVMHTTAGDMTYILYPEECPKTVANFCKLAEEGYYDGTYVFRIEPEVFFSAGAKTAGDESQSGDIAAPEERIPQELSAKLWPLRGALCALETVTEGGFWKTLTKTRETFTGSRFLVCDTIEMTDDIVEGLRTAAGDGLETVAEAFISQGGIPNYAQQITVFGQLYDGYAVLDAITEAAVTGETGNQRPQEDIIISKIEITTFSNKTT